ncbi:hypothetical protein JCM11641_002927 [Rhodosporidiobolus odoratus]
MRRARCSGRLSSHPTHSIHSHSNPDASFHHTPVGTSSSTHAPGAVNVAAPAGPEDRQTLNTHSPAPTSTTSHTTTSAVPASTPSTTSHVVEPTQSHHHSHTAPEPRVEPTRSEPAGTSATPASTTSNADPSVASNASNAKGHENAGPTAADAPATAAKEHATRGESDVGVSGPEGGAGEVGEGGYPPQLHAGKVGLGPHYNEGGGLGDKIKGVEEVIKGKSLDGVTAASLSVSYE